MTTIDAQSADLSKMRDALVDRLSRFRAQVRRQLALEGAVRLIGVVVALAALSLIADYVLHLSLWMRLAFLAVALAIIAAAAWRFLVQPLRAEIDLVGLAAAMEMKGDEPIDAPTSWVGRITRVFSTDRRHGQAAGTPRARATPSTVGGTLIAARVATVLQLPDLVASGAPASSVMVDDAVRRSHASLQGVDFDQHIDPARKKSHFIVLALLVVLPLLWAAIFHSTAGLWARRWFLGSNEAWPQKNHLQIAGLENGRIFVPRGEPYALRVTAVAGSVAPDSVMLRISEGKATPTVLAMNRFTAGDFRYDVPPVQDVVKLKVWGGDESLDPFTIEPIDRPRIAKLELVAQHPTQEKRETRTFAGGEADLAFLPKTKLALTITASQPLKEVRLHSSLKEPSSPRKIDDKHFVAEWTHEAALQMQIELVAAEGDLTSIPTPVAIGLRGDSAPKVTLAFTGVRQRVSPVAKIPLTIEARDDAGLASVSLGVKAAAPDVSDPAAAPEKVTAIFGPAKPAVETEVRETHTNELASLKPAVGSLVSIEARAEDAAFLGAQTGKSRLITFRVVSAEELFRDILLRQQQERIRYRKLVEAADKIRDQLASAPNIDAYTLAARSHRNIQRESIRIARSLADSVTEMRLNALGGPEAYELMEKSIVEPLKKLDADHMNAQRDALDALVGGDSAALAATLTRQDTINGKMKEILKQMSQWDSFVDVLNQLNEIIKLQTGVKDSTEKLKKQEDDALFKP